MSVERRRDPIPALLLFPSSSEHRCSAIRGNQASRRASHVRLYAPSPSENLLTPGMATGGRKLPPAGTRAGRCRFSTAGRQAMLIRFPSLGRHDKELEKRVGERWSPFSTDTCFASSKHQLRCPPVGASLQRSDFGCEPGAPVHPGNRMVSVARYPWMGTPSGGRRRGL